MLFFHIATSCPEAEEFPPPIDHQLRAVTMLEISTEMRFSTAKSSGAFFEHLGDGIQICSWNGRAFSVPVLTYHALRNGVDIRSYHESKPYYTYRYGDAHLDLADIYSFQGAAPRITLEQAAQLIDLPGRLFAEDKVLSANERLAALDIDVGIIALLYYKWYGHKSAANTETAIRKAMALRCKKRFETLPKKVKHYLDVVTHGG